MKEKQYTTHEEPRRRRGLAHHDAPSTPQLLLMWTQQIARFDFDVTGRKAVYWPESKHRKDGALEGEWIYSCCTLCYTPI